MLKDNLELLLISVLIRFAVQLIAYQPYTDDKTNHQ